MVTAAVGVSKVRYNSAFSKDLLCAIINELCAINALATLLSCFENALVINL